MSNQGQMSAPNEDRYEGPDAPPQGQVYVDSQGNYWKARRVTRADSPRGFFIVHLQHGVSEDQLRDSIVLGPREFAALVKDRKLKPHFHIV